MKSLLAFRRRNHGGREVPNVGAQCNRARARNRLSRRELHGSLDDNVLALGVPVENNPHVRVVLCLDLREALPVPEQGRSVFRRANKGAGEAV